MRSDGLSGFRAMISALRPNRALERILGALDLILGFREAVRSILTCSHNATRGATTLSVAS